MRAIQLYNNRLTLDEIAAQLSLFMEEVKEILVKSGYLGEA